MKHVRLFENYINDKIKSLRKLKKITDFIEKYDMQYFVIAMEAEDDNYMFEDIRKVDGVYKLDYYDYNVNKNYSDVKPKLVEITNLPNEVVDSLYRCCEKYHRFDIEYHLETDADPEFFINILKKYKKEIKFSKFMFDHFIDNEKQTFINSFKIQDLLFSTHPEAYKAFIDSCFSSIGYDYEPLKLHPKILKKYDKLLGEYYHQKMVEYDSKKYNL